LTTLSSIDTYSRIRPVNREFLFNTRSIYGATFDDELGSITTAKTVRSSDANPKGSLGQAEQTIVLRSRTTRLTGDSDVGIVEPESCRSGNDVICNGKDAIGQGKGPGEFEGAIG